MDRFLVRKVGANREHGMFILPKGRRRCERVDKALVLRREGQVMSVVNSDKVILCRESLDECSSQRATGTCEYTNSLHDTHPWRSAAHQRVMASCMLRWIHMMIQLRGRPGLCRNA